MFALTLQPTIFDGMKGAQELDPILVRIKEVLEGRNTAFSLSQDGILKFNGRLCVPNDEELRKQILSEAYGIPYSIIQEEQRCIKI